MRYFVEQVASGAAILDANGDGNLDVFFPQPKALGACKGKIHEKLRSRLYLGDGKGHFTLAKDPFGGVETDYGIAAAVGDFDNDGRPDLYVCCFGKNKLFHNNGDGTFKDVTAKAGVEVGGFSTGAVWFDYDGDGLLDLYVLRYCEWSVETDIPCLGPNGERDNCSPHIYTPARNRLFHNNGNGTFTDVTAKAGVSPEPRRSLGVAAIDIDGDGKLDLFVANDLGPNYLMHNKGDGTFEDIGMQQGVSVGADGHHQANMGVAVGDYNNTGRPSVLVTTFANEPFTLYRNEGGFFTDVSEEVGIAAPTKPYLAFGTGFLDTRNSGRLDLFFANGHVSPFAYLKNSMYTYKERNQLLILGDTGIYSEAKEALPKDDVRIHRGAVFGDFDNDGRTDILVTATDDRPTLMRNKTEGGNWLTLKLTSANGCCTPIGTKCTATFKGRKLTRWEIGGGSYGGDSDQRVHFGLGNADKVDELEIKWMSGKVQTLKDVKVNQILSIKEPKP